MRGFGLSNEITLGFVFTHRRKLAAGGGTAATENRFLRQVAVYDGLISAAYPLEPYDNPTSVA
jgi:hypothetical protein